MAVFYTGRGSGGVKLPALSNPASASEIGEGYDAINAAGERVVGTGELAVNLNPELTEQDTLIADIMTTLEGKAVPSAPEVVKGTFTAAGETTVTISELIGKENVFFMFSGYQDGIVGPVVPCAYKLDGEDVVHLLHGLASGDILNYASPSASTWDSTTGTLTFAGGFSYSFLSGNYNYIGW